MQWSTTVDRSQIPDHFEYFALTEAQKVQRLGTPVRNQQIRTVIDQHISKNTLNITDWCLTLNSCCEHRGIVERIEMLSPGPNSLNMVEIRYIPAKRDMQPVVSLGEGQCFHEASEVPRVLPLALLWLHSSTGLPHRTCRSYISLGRDMSSHAFHSTLTCSPSFCFLISLSMYLCSSANNVDYIQESKIYEN